MCVCFSKPVTSSAAPTPTTYNARGIYEDVWGQAPRKAYFTRVCVSILPQRSRHHCQELGDFLRVAGGVGSDATAEAIDGRAGAKQLRDKGHA